MQKSLSEGMSYQLHSLVVGIQEIYSVALSLPYEWAYLGLATQAVCVSRGKMEQQQLT